MAFSLVPRRVTSLVRNIVAGPLVTMLGRSSGVVILMDVSTVCIHEGPRTVLGGLQSFGLVGVFLGPVVMAAFVTVWREGVEAESLGNVAESGSLSPDSFRAGRMPGDGGWGQ